MLIYNISFLYLLFINILQPTDVESFEESDDDGSEYSEASEDSDSEGIVYFFFQINI